MFSGTVQFTWCNLTLRPNLCSRVLCHGLCRGCCLIIQCSAWHISFSVNESHVVTPVMRCIQWAWDRPLQMGSVFFSFPMKYKFSYLNAICSLFWTENVKKEDILGISVSNSEYLEDKNLYSEMAFCINPPTPHHCCTLLVSRRSGLGLCPWESTQNTDPLVF